VVNLFFFQVIEPRQLLNKTGLSGKNQSDKTVSDQNNRVLLTIQVCYYQYITKMFVFIYAWIITYADSPETRYLKE
jgi:hypothetical protein